MLLRLVLIGLVFIMASCSPVVSERDQYIRVSTPKTENAKCRLEDKRGFWWRVRSPETIKVDKGYPPLTIICQKLGYHTTTVQITDRYTPEMVSDFFADKIGYVLPAYQHSSNQYPYDIKVWMRPIAFETTAERDQWEREFAQYRQEEDQKLYETDKSLKGYYKRFDDRVLTPGLDSVKKAGNTAYKGVVSPGLRRSME